MKPSPISRLFFHFQAVGGLLTIIAAIFLSIAPAWAHKVNVFAYVEGDKVSVEGYFSANVKAQDSLVEVFDSAGTKILEGKTDGKGIYAFKLTDLPPVKGDIKIVLDAGMGHKADFTLSAADLPVTTQKTRSPELESEKKESAGLAMAAAPSVQTQDPDILKKVVENVVKHEIEPLVKMIGSQQKLLMEQRDKGPSMTDIFGGIGWIMGIVGIAAYFMSRNPKTKT